MSAQREVKDHEINLITRKDVIDTKYSYSKTTLRGYPFNIRMFGGPDGIGGIERGETETYTLKMLVPSTLQDVVRVINRDSFENVLDLYLLGMAQDVFMLEKEYEEEVDEENCDVHGCFGCGYCTGSAGLGLDAPINPPYKRRGDK